jgi:AcrR family transcriptional regulator
MKNSTVRKPRRQAKHDHRARRQEEILDAAVRLFAVNSYAETDTQVLADALRVGKGTLYRYFPSKRALFLAAADRVMQQLRAAVDAAIAGLDDPLERIAQAVRTYLTFFAANPEYAELLIQERAQFKDRKKPTYFEHCDANVERWRELYRSLIAAGRVRPIPPERITDVISDLLYGTMFTNYFTGGRKSPEQQTEDILDIVFHGILTGPERRRRGAE